MSDIDNIKRAVSADSHILAELAVRMWSKHTVAELEEEFAKLICGENAACFIKYVGGRPVGFAQCGLRFDYVEGTESSPVGYLEGVYILPEFSFLLRGSTSADGAALRMRSVGEGKELHGICQRLRAR